MKDNLSRIVQVGAFELADTPTTNAKFAKGIAHLGAQTSILLVERPDHHFVPLARGTEAELRGIRTGDLRRVVSEMFSYPAEPVTVGDYVLDGGLRAFDFGRQVRIVPVTLAAVLSEDFSGPNQPALVTPVMASAFAAVFGLRLPTGEQWEAAAGDLRDEKYLRVEELRRVAHFQPASATADVKSKEPNTFGIFDMLGNVWEIMANPYRADEVGREIRGGAWGDDPGDVRVALRDCYHPGYWDVGIGFRLSRPQDPEM